MKTKKQTAKDVAEILAGAGDAVVHILPDGEVKILDTDPAIDKAYNAGIERCSRWHMTMSKRAERAIPLGGKTGAVLHASCAGLLRKLKR